LADFLSQIAHDRKVPMNHLTSLYATATALLLAIPFSGLAQQPDGPAAGPQSGGGRGAGQGRGGFGGRGFRFGGPALPAEQQAEVDRINIALQAENAAVTMASSNLVAATFITPLDKEKIGKANEELAKARQAWAMKASRLVAEAQASDKKLSTNAIAVLVQNAGGRGGRGGFGRFGFGAGGSGGFPPGGPGSEDGRSGDGAGRRSAPNP
jgi:hypothetical protein